MAGGYGLVNWRAGQSLIQPVNGLELVYSRKPCTWTLMYCALCALSAALPHFIIIIIVVVVVVVVIVVPPCSNCIMRYFLAASNAT